MNDKQQITDRDSMSRAREGEIDLLELGKVFLSHARFIVIWFLAGAIVAGAWSFLLVDPTYDATAKMYIVSASNNSIVDLTDLNIGTSLTTDYEALLTCDPVTEQVISDLNLDCTPQELLQMVTITNPADTRVLEITARTTSPRLSKDLANTFMDVSIEYLPETMSTNPPNVAQRAKVPDEKSGPSNSRNTLLGALVGLIIALGWLTIRYMSDDTIHSADEFETYFGIVPLATIPEGESLAGKERDGGKGKGRRKAVIKGSRKSSGGGR